MIALGVATAIQVMSNLENTTDVHEVGMIGSLNQVYKSMNEKSEGTESIVSDSHSKSISSAGTKTSRNTTPPESRVDQLEEKSVNGQQPPLQIITNQSIAGIFPDFNSVNSDKQSNDQQSISTPNTYENEKSPNSIRLNNLQTLNNVQNSPLTQRVKRFNSLGPIPETFDNQPGTPRSSGIKRRGSKSFDGMLPFDTINPRSTYEKNRPKSFTLAPNTPLTPMILALFDDRLPSEQYTINCIMHVKILFLSFFISFFI